MAPVIRKSSPAITGRVSIEDVEVNALVDTGATTSYCGWDSSSTTGGDGQRISSGARLYVVIMMVDEDDCVLAW